MVFRWRYPHLAARLYDHQKRCCDLAFVFIAFPTSIQNDSYYTIFNSCMQAQGVVALWSAFVLQLLAGQAARPAARSHVCISCCVIGVVAKP